MVITVGNTKPTATIAAPSAGSTWRVGRPISFAGSATDPQQGALPAAALSWRLTLIHCAPGCHPHVVQEWPGVGAGTFSAPDHEYPSYLELELTATDAGGLTDVQKLRLDPRTVTLSMATSPSGLTLGLNQVQATAPFSRAVIEGSANTISAPSPQTRNKNVWAFQSWSDGNRAATRTVTANASTTYSAAYRKR